MGCREEHGRLTPPSRPFTLSQVREGKQDFPPILLTVAQLVRQFRQGVLQDISGVCRPPCKLLSDRPGSSLRVALPEPGNELAALLSAHLDQDRTIAHRVRDGADSAQCFWAVAAEISDCDIRAGADADRGDAVRLEPSVENLAKGLGKFLIP